MTRTVCFLVGFVLALLPAMAGATGTWHGTLAVAEAQAMGNNTSDATLVVLLQEYTLPEHEMGVPGFLLEAEFLRIETDHTNLSVSANAYGHRNDPHTFVQNHHNATVAGLEHRSKYQFSVWPLQENALVRASTTCATISASPIDEVQRIALVGDREESVAETRGALAWRDCDNESRLTVQGDFLVRLWEWDVQLETGGETALLSSGKRNLEQTPSIAPDMSDSLGQADEQYLYAYNATLILPLAGSFALFVQDAEVTAPAGVELRGASGRLVGPVPLDVDDQDVFLQGDASFTFHGTSATSPVAVEFNGDFWHVTIDGTPLAIAAPDASFDAAWSGGFIIVALLAAAALVVRAYPLWLYRRLHDDPTIQSIEAPTNRERRAVVYGRYSNRAIVKARSLDGRRSSLGFAWALLLANRGHRFYPECKMFHVWRSWAYMGLERPHKALQECRLLDGLLVGREAKARNAWLAAQCADILGLDEEAWEWVILTERYDIRLLMDEARADQRAPITYRPWMRGILERNRHQWSYA